MVDHHSNARHHAHQATEALKQVTDPGQRAYTHALIALTHAVLSTGEDVGKVSSTLIEMEDVLRR